MADRADNSGMPMRNYDYMERSEGPQFQFGPGRPPAFILSLMITCAAMFVAQRYVSGVNDWLALAPAGFISEFPRTIFQPLTYMFLHGGFGHLFFNMFTLWMFGTEIERAWGSATFARFFIFAGVVGVLLQTVVMPNSLNPIVGASGGIYGVLVAYWLMFPHRYLLVYFLFPVKVMWAIPVFMLLGFLFAGGNIAHLVHLGGALYGLAYLKLDWRWISLGRKLKSLRYRRQEAKLERRRVEAEDMMKKVDAILDRINEVGIENLSRSERKFLENASDLLAKRKGMTERHS